MYLFHLQILVLYDALDTVDVKKIIEYVKKLQQPDGSFYGDKWGNVLIVTAFSCDKTIFLHLASIL